MYICFQYLRILDDKFRSASTMSWNTKCTTTFFENIDGLAIYHCDASATFGSTKFSQLCPVRWPTLAPCTFLWKMNTCEWNVLLSTTSFIVSYDGSTTQREIHVPDNQGNGLEQIDEPTYLCKTLSP